MQDQTTKSKLMHTNKKEKPARKKRRKERANSDCTYTVEPLSMCVHYWGLEKSRGKVGAVGGESGQWVAKDFKRNLPLRYALVLLLLLWWHSPSRSASPHPLSPGLAVFKKFYARHERNLLHSGVQSFYPFHTPRLAIYDKGIRAP